MEWVMVPGPLRRHLLSLRRRPSARGQLMLADPRRSYFCGRSKCVCSSVVPVASSSLRGWLLATVNSRDLLFLYLECSGRTRGPLSRSASSYHVCPHDQHPSIRLVEVQGEESGRALEQIWTVLPLNDRLGPCHDSAHLHARHRQLRSPSLPPWLPGSLHAFLPWLTQLAPLH